MHISIPSVRLEDVVKEDVLLMKVDVEGWEWSVMKGAAKLVAGFNVENIIMEYSPGGEGQRPGQYQEDDGQRHEHPTYHCVVSGGQVKAFS